MTGDQIPSFLVILVAVDVSEKELSPPFAPRGGEKHIGGKNVEAGRLSAVASALLLFRVSKTTIEGGEHNEIAVDLFDQEPAVIVGGPSAFDLDATRSVMFGF